MLDSALGLTAGTVSADENIVPPHCAVSPVADDGMHVSQGPAVTKRCVGTVGQLILNTWLSRVDQLSGPSPVKASRPRRHSKWN